MTQSAEAAARDVPAQRASPREIHRGVEAPAPSRPNSIVEVAPDVYALRVVVELRAEVARLTALLGVTPDRGVIDVSPTQPLDRINLTL